MKYPDLIAWLGKQASVGVAYPRPRPAETPAQAKRAVGAKSNMATGGVFQQAAPQQQPPPKPQPPQQPAQAARLPQVEGIQ